MGLFGKKRGPALSDEERIAEFWREWPTIRPRVIAALRSEKYEQVPSIIGPAIKALHPDVVWGIGGAGPYELEISPEGDRELLNFTVAWAGAAPNDPDFLFAPAKLPTENGCAGLVVSWRNQEIDLGETTFAAFNDPDADLLMLALYHPSFVSVDQETRAFITFQVLDAELGELAVLRRVGQLEILDEPIEDMEPASHLRGLFRERFPEG